MAGLPWLPVSVEPGAREQPSVRAILRVVVTVVLSAVALFLVYSVRVPLGWLVLATFLAVAASGPVNFLARHMRRGAAVALVYLGIVLIPIGIALILLPPVIEQGVKLANNLPSYARELNQAFNENPQLQELNKDYDITKKLEDAAQDLVSRIGQAAGALASIGAGVVGSVFALVTILVMSMFMVSRGARWRDAALSFRPPTRPSGSAAPAITSRTRSGATSPARCSRPSWPEWSRSSCW